MGVNHSRVFAKCILDACDNSTGDQISLTHLDTPAFHEHLGDFLHNLVITELSEKLQAVLNKYVSIKAPTEPPIRWHSIDVEEWIRNPSSILTTLPPRPPEPYEPSENYHIINQLYQGLSVEDRIIRRIWIVQFTYARDALAEIFYDKGRSNPMSKLITDPTREEAAKKRLCTDSAYVGRHLAVLKKRHPALLLTSGGSNDYFEQVLPIHEEDLEAITNKVSSMKDSSKYEEAVIAVSEFLKKEFDEWLEDISAQARALYEPKKRKRTDERLPISLAVTAQNQPPAVTAVTLPQSTHDASNIPWFYGVEHTSLFSGLMIPSIGFEDALTYMAEDMASIQ